MSEEKVEATSGRSRSVQGSVESAKMDKTITVLLNVSCSTRCTRNISVDRHAFMPMTPRTSARKGTS
jgi:ribosomal protein S17